MSPQETPLYKLDDGLSSEEQLSSLITEEKRLQQCWVNASTKSDRSKYQAQLKNLIQTKQALKCEIDKASLPAQLNSNNTHPGNDGDASAPNTAKHKRQSNKLVYELGSITPKQQSHRGRHLALVASLVMVTGAALFIEQSGFDFSQLLAKIESQPHQQPAEPAELVQLKNEISELITRLDKKEIELQGKSVTDQTVYDLTQRVIFQGHDLAELKQKKTQADLLSEKKEYQSLLPLLADVKQGYLELLSNLDNAEPMAHAHNDVVKNKDKWLEFKRKYEIDLLKSESHAESQLNRANSERDMGQLALAKVYYQTAAQDYLNILNGPEASEAIAAKHRAEIITKLNNEMLELPRGVFRMGDLSDDGGIDEKPVRSVMIAPFALKKTEVTFEQYDAFADATGRPRPDDDGWGRGDRPVINVSWHDAVAFSEWLSKETGKKYRLPTEAEWEYAARAESKAKYSWGEKPNARHANANEDYDWPDDGYHKKTAPVATFSANDFGLYDMHGNVLEWTQDCWKFNYQDSSPSGKAWQKGDCNKRVRRGGSWVTPPEKLRTSKRSWSSVTTKSSINGFRLAQDLP